MRLFPQWPIGIKKKSTKCWSARDGRRRCLSRLRFYSPHCCEDAPQVISAFVVDLYAEASRNPHVADLVRDVLQTAMDGVTDLIARSPEAESAAHGLKPHELAELTFAISRGMLMRDVLQPQEMTAAERRTRQLEVTRRLWSLLFRQEREPTYA